MAYKGRFFRHDLDPGAFRPLPEGEGTKILPENAPPSPVEREEQDTLFLAPHSDTIGLSWVERTLSTAVLPTRRQDDGVQMDQHPH